MDEIVGGRQRRALDHPVLGPGERGIEHPKPAVVPGDAHRPDLVIVALARLSGADRVRKRVPGQTVRGHHVLDDIVIGQREVEEMKLVPMGKDLDVADFRQTMSARRVHDGVSSGWGRGYRGSHDDPDERKFVS